MTLDDAVSAVEATLPDDDLVVDLKRARADADTYLLVVLDTSTTRPEGVNAANGPRLIDRATGEVTRLTVVEALERSRGMELVSA